METISKILILIVIQIFASAAAATYLMDSNFLASLIVEHSKSKNVSVTHKQSNQQTIYIPENKQNEKELPNVRK